MAEASLEQLQKLDKKLPEDLNERMEYLTKRQAELDRKIATQERRMGRSLGEIEVRKGSGRGMWLGCTYAACSMQRTARWLEMLGLIYGGWGSWQHGRAMLLPFSLKAMTCPAGCDRLQCRIIKQVMWLATISA